MKPKKELNVLIGEQVKRARENSRLTQEQFAELIDKTPQFISDLERGVTGISLETLKVICEKLCITSDSILFPDRPHNDVDQLAEKFRNMTPAQFKGMGQITNAFLYAVNMKEQG